MDLGRGFGVLGKRSIKRYMLCLENQVGTSCRSDSGIGSTRFIIISSFFSFERVKKQGLKDNFPTLESLQQAQATVVNNYTLEKDCPLRAI